MASFDPTMNQTFDPTWNATEHAKYFAWAMKDPRVAACVIATPIAVIGVAAPVLLTGPILGMLGFGAGGVLAGSWAAYWQALMGNVAGGSWFAFGQSAGAGGFAAATANAVLMKACAAAAAGCVALFANNAANCTGSE